MPVLDVVRGDRHYFIEFSVRTADGLSGVDITGASPLFKVAKNYGSDPLWSGICELVTPARGVCQYFVKPQDFNVPGAYVGELEVTYPGTGRVVTAGMGLRINVSEDIGR